MTRMPVGYAAFKQGWQPNRSVRIDNIGDTDVRNPWVMLNGSGDWRTLAAVVAEATRGAETEGEKAAPCTSSRRRRRFHACTWDNECSDAIKALNVYGYTLCGNQAIVLRDLWNAAGLKTRRCRPIGHSVAEVFYDGAFHMLDSDEHVIGLLRDNETIGSEEDIGPAITICSSELTPTVSRPRIAARRTNPPLPSTCRRRPSEGDLGPGTQHTMDLTLRPGEGIELRWDHVRQTSTGGSGSGAGREDCAMGWATSWPAGGATAHRQPAPQRQTAVPARSLKPAGSSRRRRCR